ncbi:unnamed protein product [Cylicocyclus nassatus]|uniref:poly(ADP-ribose) glycohydrolase n=1 Tax=Cylicocyclus nassatus TaxID=53992 RepID=A0AA36HFH1_CYLNA|nr:unnamed protein product [Cylicocyclus nassatus]
MSSNTARYNDILAKARWYRCSPEVLELQPDLNALDEEKDYCAFCVSTLCEDCPPKPNTVSCKDKKPNFRKRFVELPWSTDNVVDGQQRYAIIGKALEDLATNGAGSVEDVINTIKQYASWVPSFDGLRDYVDHRKSQRILQTITGIAALAVKAKCVITGPLPLLSASQSGSVTLSQEQCACILANGFFCTFPKERGFCNEINFSEIFHAADQLSHGRLDFLLHYFSRVLEKMPTGCVSFCRTALKEDTFPNWANDESQLQSVAVDQSGGFGIFLGCAPVYFPYRMIGGSVLSPTPLNVYQEGIRFLVCPELIVSCLLCEPMTVSWLREPEAIQIVGAQLFNNCERYSDGGGWIYSPAPGPSYYRYDDQDRDKFRRVTSEVIVLNAPFNIHRWQYTKEGIDDELNKA